MYKNNSCLKNKKEVKGVLSKKIRDIGWKEKQKLTKVLFSYERNINYQNW